MRAMRLFVAAVILSGTARGAWSAETATASPVLPHPYGSASFSSLVDDSCRTTGVVSVKEFYDWMDSAGLQAARSSFYAPTGRTWTEVLEYNRQELAKITDPEMRARREMGLGVWLHRMVKRAFPNYSLERGFELSNAAGRQERQCLLQSMVISSLLQAMGVDAGTAMVNQNREGQYTNNTHVVVMLKMSNGRDVLVDGSYPEPIVVHRGLMALVPGSGYRYVRPVYSDDYREILSYLEMPSRRPVSTAAVRPMDLPFVRSQVNFYRGERTPGGVLSKRASKDGLERSIRFFQASLGYCQYNPLPAYMLGQALEKQGLLEEARRQYQAAKALYSQAGWIPNEVQRAATRTRARDGSIQ